MKTLKRKYFISIAMVGLVFSFFSNFLSDFISKDVRSISEIARHCDSSESAPDCERWCK